MRGRRSADLPLVADLLARLRPYEVQGVVCRCCRRFATEEQAEAARWTYWGGAAGERFAWCPKCAEQEYGVPIAHEPSESRRH